MTAPRSAAQVDAIRELVVGMPLAQHISDNGEVLPYVLINDLARCYASTVQQLGAEAAGPLVDALELLAVSPHQDVRGLLTEFFSSAGVCRGR